MATLCLCIIAPLTAKAGTVTTISGNGFNTWRDGPAGVAGMSGPIGMARDASGNIYIADTNNHCIRIIDTNGNEESVKDKNLSQLHMSLKVRL